MWIALSSACRVRMLSLKRGPVERYALSLLIITCVACASAARFEPAFLAHPDDANKRIEYYVRAPAGTVPRPAIVFIHGHQSIRRPGGADFVKWGVLDKYAKQGFVAVAVSQPGYGESDGPPDYCGPFTQKAVIAVVEKLERDGIVSPDGTILQGVSRGAIVAGLVAARKPAIKAVVLISGIYDFNEYVADPKTNLVRRNIVAAMKAETGGSATAFRERSVLAFAQVIRARVLILHGERDERTDPRQARRLADAIRAAGGRARVVVFPEYGHQIPVAVRNEIIDPFIQEGLGAKR